MDAGTFDGILWLFGLFMAVLGAWLAVRLWRAVSSTSREAETDRFRRTMIDAVGRRPRRDDRKEEPADGSRHVRGDADVR